MNRQPQFVPEPQPGATRRTSGRGVAARVRTGRKEKNRRKPDLLAPVRFLVLVALVAQCVRVAFTSPRLTLSRVEVRGSQRLSPQDIQQLAHIPMGENIFAVNLASVAEDLRRDPIIKELSVTRYLPNTVSITIHDRQPVLQLITRSGRYLADAENIVYRKVTGAEIPSGLPQIGLPLRLLPKIGEKLDPRTQTTIRLCLELSRKEQVKLTYIRIDGSGEVWLNVQPPTTGSSSPAQASLASPSLGGNLKVRLGRPTELAEKFRDIRQTLAALPHLAGSATHLDVMCAGRPSYRPKPQPKPEDSPAGNLPAKPEALTRR